MEMENEFDTEQEPSLADVLRALERLERSTAENFARLRGELDEPGEDAEEPDEEQEPILPAPVATPVPVPEQPVTHVPQVVSEGGWDQILLGNQLAPVAGQLMADLSAGDASARELVGQLLIVRSVPAERIPKLLKEVGEAYYQWQPYQPNHDSPFLLSLVEWLTGICESSGLGNAIRLCRAGDRFDANRHIAKERGIEVTDVFGWIVLRDNGKVYSKASVSVK